MAAKRSEDSVPSGGPSASPGKFSSLYNIADNDPDRSWTPTRDMPSHVLEHISELMIALGELRQT